MQLIRIEKSQDKRQNPFAGGQLRDTLLRVDVINDVETMATYTSNTSSLRRVMESSSYKAHVECSGGYPYLIIRLLTRLFVRPVTRGVAYVGGRTESQNRGERDFGCIR